MASQWIRNTVFGYLLLALASRTHGLAISYCSPDLTAGNLQAVYNQWQSNGACANSCPGYAFAVLQGPNCWCSNYAPADQVSTYSCNTQCPGWPDDWCGQSDQGLYGYYALGGTVKGTTGSSSPTSSKSPSVSNTPSSPGSSTAPFSWPFSFGGSSSLTVTSPLQSSIRTTLATVGQTSSAARVIPSVLSSSTKTITNAATPTEVYTSIMTVTGQVKTVLVTPTPTTDSTLGSGTQINGSGGGVSTGKVVGIVVGVALGLGLIIGIGVWMWFRRRHRQNMEAASLAPSSAHDNHVIPSRQVSQLSSAGLLGKAPRIQTTGLPMANNPRSADTLASNFDRRSVGTDQRLNPYAIYAHDESRHSNVSLQDNQDYSRQLRVANPDP